VVLNDHDDIEVDGVEYDRTCVFVLTAVKSDYQGRISEGIHQAFVAAESIRMYLV